MAFFGVELNAQVNRLMGLIKLSLNKNKYYPNFRTIYRTFVSFDSEQTGLVNVEQLDKVLQGNGIFFKKYEVQALQKGFDKDGKVNWFGLMSMLREPMNAFREDLVNEVFNFIDQEHSGQIHFNDLCTLEFI
jgi:Ca2+-binding EF-hand superfamily protein